ncbi:MAG: sulfatase-like hydrolase/transferase [Candidatus Solibacter usitatus]|nr:sulfatase-like hydrolase/transferase [Candidatus Solibacter usitatus]
MTRREILTAPAAFAQTATSPNVLWIMTDQHRFDCIGANGNRLIRTPNLDGLAARSRNFQQAFVQSPVCVPSRMSYFTGRYPHSHKNRVNYTPLDSRETLAPRMFREGGYQTGSVGKLHYHPPTAAHARSMGWDKVLLDDGTSFRDDYSDYAAWVNVRNYHATKPLPGKNPFRGALPYEQTVTAWTGMETRRMLRDFAGGTKPFFLHSSFFKPHAPYTVPEPFDSMYDGVEIPLPRRYTLDDIHKLPLPVQRQILRRPQNEMDRTRLQWIYRSYYASVSMIDKEIGLILDELERSGKVENTVVLLTTDHGDQLLEHGLVDKNVFFESSVRVPFLLSFAQRVKPGKNNELVEMVDVLPTLLELCGLPPRKEIQGRSLLTASPREFAFAENVMPEVITNGGLDLPYVPGQGVGGILHPDAKMIRGRRWKLNYYPGHGGELYDLENDPNEERNLYGEAATQSVVREWKDRLLDFLITSDETDQIAPRWKLGSQA